jgi:hypothetical protein
MKKSKYFPAILRSSILVVCIILGSSAVCPGTQERLTLRFPLKISEFSTVRLSTKKGEPASQNILGAWITMYYGSDPAEHLWVSIGKLNLREAGPGYYVGQEGGSAVFPNRLIEIAVKPAPAMPFKKPSTAEKEAKPLATGQARLTNILEIVSPTLLETIDLAAVSSVTVRWRFTSGAGPISRLVVLEGTGEAKLFEQLDVPGESFNISKSIFRPGRQYSIWLTRNNPDFVLAGDVASSSRVKLQFMTWVAFNTR